MGGNRGTDTEGGKRALKNLSGVQRETKYMKEDTIMEYGINIQIKKNSLFFFKLRNNFPCCKF